MRIPFLLAVLVLALMPATSAMAGQAKINAGKHVITYDSDRWYGRKSGSPHLVCKHGQCPSMQMILFYLSERIDMKRATSSFEKIRRVDKRIASLPFDLRKVVSINDMQVTGTPLNGRFTANINFKYDQYIYIGKMEVEFRNGGAKGVAGLSRNASVSSRLVSQGKAMISPR